ncbi:hypothetical protein C8R47DRAFT_106624 [Mycena vitilis]|nr:hypothetical protein C8R47DRAFT_106624 [Mycena vitilis]
MFQRAVDEHGCTLWVRGSNHRLCVSDMILNDDTSHSYSYMKPIDHWRPGREETEIMSYNGPNHEAVAAFSLGLSQYHKILAHYSWPSTRNFIFPTHATVCIGMVLKCMADGELDDGELDDGELDQVELPVIIAVVPHLNGENSSGWHSMRYSWKGGSYIRSGCRDGHLMPNFWRRFNLHQIFHDQALPKHCKCMINCSFFLNCSELWLGQANHIFSSLHVTSEHYQYAVVDTVSFAWVLAPTTHSSLSSRGWLFVCPDSQLRSGPCSYRWPECAAYWSFDPFGAQRLSKEEAEDAGFPVIKLELKVSGSWWDASDYAGLWRFHEGKGFAPDSQEIARHLGHPLYQLCDELAVETPLADVSDEETETCQHPADTLGATSRGEAQTVHFDLGGENKTSRSIHAVSTGFNYAFKLPTSILVLVVLCCLFRTAE